MATKEQKKLYVERIKPYKSRVEELRKKIAARKTAARKKPRMEAYMRIASAIDGLGIANTLNQMSSISVVIQEFKNETMLNDARKELGNLLGELLKIVGESADGGLTENKESLEKIAYLDWASRLKLMKGIREALVGVTESMGQSSKWRWSFPEMHYRLFVASRNSFDFKAYDRVRKQPQTPENQPFHDFLAFIIEQGQLVAQEYRSRYELSTKNITDLQMIQRVFDVLKKIFILLGNQNEVTKIQNSMTAITAKIEDIEKEKEAEKKKK